MDKNNFLIISNRSFSYTDNNGKTLLSLVEKFPKECISQLYFYQNIPDVEGYNYFQLSDADIIKGKISSKRRGRQVAGIKKDSGGIDKILSSRSIVKRSSLTLLIRDLLWRKSWNSLQLKRWLNEVKPDKIFFMAGDCLYAYEICAWIKKEYQCELYTYVTDDYILPRSAESIIDKFYRKKVWKALKCAAVDSSIFFTICDRMRNAYKEEIGINSEVLFNQCDSLYDEAYRNKTSKEIVVFTYAGSLYYGRGQLLIELAKVLQRLNSENNTKKLMLDIYTNQRPDDEFMAEIIATETANYGGSLSKEELKKKLNECDFPVFVESFEKKEIEKTRLSFSTKVPEYLSLEKPIIAIGPDNIGSMDCLKDVAICVSNPDDMYDTIKKIINAELDFKLYEHRAKIKFAKMKTEKNLCDYLKG